MKEQDIKLTLQETEQLCRMYMDCRLTVLEEAELRYVLDKLPYSTPCIDEARQAMAAELSMSPREKTAVVGQRHRWRFGWIAGIAASIALVLAFSIPYIASERGDVAGEGMFIAYEGGRKLDPESSEIAVESSLKRAEALMAMAEALEKEDELRIQKILKPIKE